MHGTHTTVNLQAFMNRSTQIRGHTDKNREKIMHEYQSVPKMNIFLLMGGGGPQNNNYTILLLHLTKCHQKCYQTARNNVNNQTVCFFYFQGRGGGLLR